MYIMIQFSELTDSPNSDFSSKENQEARAFLRERFLRVLSTLTGKPCQIHTVENSIVSGEFQGCGLNIDHYLIKNLKTPLFQFSSSLVRATDVQNISFPNAMTLNS